MKKLERRCWQCNGQLMSISHAEVQTPNGVVLVHKCCAVAVKEYFRRITAQPKDLATVVVD